MEYANPVRHHLGIPDCCAGDRDVSKKAKDLRKSEIKFFRSIRRPGKLDESAKLWNALKKTNEHNHDRLSGYEDDSCTSEEHWKKQLDDFLSAGIISKQEYAELLKQRQQQYHE